MQMSNHYVVYLKLTILSMNHISIFKKEKKKDIGLVHLCVRLCALVSVHVGRGMANY